MVPRLERVLVRARWHRSEGRHGLHEGFSQYARGPDRSQPSAQTMDELLMVLLLTAACTFPFPEWLGLGSGEDMLRKGSTTNAMWPKILSGSCALLTISDTSPTEISG